MKDLSEMLDKEAKIWSPFVIFENGEGFPYNKKLTWKECEEMIEEIKSNKTLVIGSLLKTITGKETYGIMENRLIPLVRGEHIALI